MLSGDLLEASVSASRPGEHHRGKDRPYDTSKRHWESAARGTDVVAARAAQLVLLVDEARNLAPITHGQSNDADAAVAEAAERLSLRLELQPRDAGALPRDVDQLLHEILPAVEITLGSRPPAGALSLTTMHDDLVRDLTMDILTRQETTRTR